MAHPLRFGVAYDFRNPAESPLSPPDFYQRALDQIRLIDQLGYDQVWITEHHFVDDGYMPSFAVAAAAIAAVTSRVRISSDIVLLPFQHPLRLAEDLAVLDNLSGGRMELGVGMGYAQHEFRAFGIPPSHRVSLTEEGLEVLRLAWRGERFSFAGKRWQFEDVRVTPLPVQPGGPPLWVAAMSAGGARRAARFRTHLLPQGDRTQALDPWRAALREAGDSPDAYRVGLLRPWLVTDDPEALWPRLREAERYRADMYADWIGAANRSANPAATESEHAEPIPQTYIIGDAPHVIEEIERFTATYGFTDLVTWGSPPGVSPELLNESHERFARDVIPHFR